MRWEDASPRQPWSGSLDAKSFGHPCIGGNSGGHLPENEDCLFLNVWRSSKRSSS